MVRLFIANDWVGGLLGILCWGAAILVVLNVYDSYAGFLAGIPFHWLACAISKE